MAEGVSSVGRQIVRAVVRPVLVAALLALPVGPVVAEESDPPAYLIEAGTARPTRAWVSFCVRNPQECRVNPREKGVIAYSPALRADLDRINTEVNRTIEAVTDIDHWGVSDRWDFPSDGIGDCEDIQIEKRRRLSALGYPVKAMRMAVVINPEGEGHAVLVVRTDRGDLVLDNRTNDILPWYASRYSWVKREADDGSHRWIALGRTPAPAVETAGNRP
jgi:predicted transglutaminase-like cysteine proteinase